MNKLTLIPILLILLPIAFAIDIGEGTWYAPSGGGNFTFLQDTTVSEVNLQDAYFFVNLTSTANITNVGTKGNLSIASDITRTIFNLTNGVSIIYSNTTSSTVNISVEPNDVFYISVYDPPIEELSIKITDLPSENGERGLYFLFLFVLMFAGVFLIIAYPDQILMIALGMGIAITIINSIL